MALQDLHIHTTDHLGSEMQSCIRECLECHATCLQTVMHCLTLGGKHSEVNHIRTLLDCAEICQTSANFMLRESPQHAQTCALCADLCERCAQECERFGNDDFMQTCAEICRLCATSCRRMVRMAA